MKNKKGGQSFFSKFVILVVCLLLVANLVPRAKNFWELSGRKNDLEQKKTEMLKQQEVLAQQLESLDCPQTIEKIAREELGMVKKGETFVLEVLNDE